MTERTRLERAALDAHRRGDDWKTFWPTVAGAVAELEPWDRDAYHRLVRRLSFLLTCGNGDGERPAGDWLDDVDEPVAVPIISDTETAARLLWSPPSPKRSPL
jgi:hypothetical protein